MKQLKDYLHLYLGTSIIASNGTRLQLASDNLEQAINQNWTPEIRPLIDMTEEDFYSFNRDEQGEDILVIGKINDLWCAGLYDKDEYEERVKEELSTDPIELLYDLEESDHTNILSCDKQGHIAYGVSEEWRFFVDLPTQSNWLNHLRKRGFDCDRLIDNGLAINKTSV